MLECLKKWSVYFASVTVIAGNDENCKGQRSKCHVCVTGSKEKDWETLWNLIIKFIN